MMQLLKITLLWMAGALVIGHSIIPHHHHLSQEQQCATEHDTPSHASFSSENCVCDHHQEHTEVCTLDQRTIVKNHPHLFTAIHIETFHSPIPKAGNSLTFNSYKNPIALRSYYEERPAREPPMA